MPKPTVASLNQDIETLAAYIETLAGKSIELEKQIEQMNADHEADVTGLTRVMDNVSSQQSACSARLGRLQAKCETEFVTDKVFQERWSIQGQAIDLAAQQTLKEMKSELRHDWNSRIAHLTGDLAYLKGLVQTGVTELVERMSACEGLADRAYARAFRPTLIERIRNWWPQRGDDGNGND